MPAAAASSQTASLRCHPQKRNLSRRHVYSTLLGLKRPASSAPNPARLKWEGSLPSWGLLGSGSSLPYTVYHILPSIYYILYITDYILYTLHSIPIAFLGYLNPAVATVVDDAPARRTTASRPWSGSRCAGAVGWAPLGLAACLGSSSLILYNIVRYSII